MEVRELAAGSADQLVALYAAVLPDSPTARAERLDEPETFLRDPSWQRATGGTRAEW